MQADSHLHSFYSIDSKCSMEIMVKRAIELGLDEITFTEHVEHDYNPLSNCDYEAYFAEIDQMRKKYGSQITVKRGIEFGLQDINLNLFQKDREKYDFDFIILSTHSVHGEHIASGEYINGKTQEELHTIYYENILDLTEKYKDYSVLGHIDYIKRYDLFGQYPDEKILDIVKKIFCRVIADGKGIEVNSSSFKYKMEDLTPSRKLLKLYYDLGGEIITIGSDAHDARYIGDHFKEIKSCLQEIGFKKFCTFDKMRPIFHWL